MHSHFGTGHGHGIFFLRDAFVFYYFFSKGVNQFKKKMSKLNTSIGGIKLASPILNASGPLTKNWHHLKRIDQSASSAVLSKTCTIKPKTGNFGPKLQIIDEAISLNADGLENHGIHYYKELKFLKPYIVSIHGDPKAMFQMLQILASKDNVCGVEVNLSCPNIDHNAHFHIREILEQITRAFHKPFGLKFPAFYSLADIENIIKMVVKYPVGWITAINTLGNAFLCDNEQALILPNNGFGGLGGRGLKPIALGNIRMIWLLLQKYNRMDIDIIGVGGVESGQDVFDMILCGASAVQVGTRHLIEGSKCFQRILDELITIMNKKQYQDISAFKGKIQCAKL